MLTTPVIAIFDIGKTNKKLFLFDEQYQIVYEESVCLPETVDEDGDACEDLNSLQSFIFSSLQKVLQNKAFRVRAVNFSTYGASFVNIDETGQPVTPLYNYLKKYPMELQKQFYAKYGGEKEFSVRTASPVLGHLNSGMQLYWLKHQKPQVFERIKTSLHLPQYASFLLTNHKASELTSIGCHTNLWDFAINNYHEWVTKEGIAEKIACIVPSATAVPAALPDSDYCVGVGLHDSSAALIPYLSSFNEPFVLLSTGTWCISLNPFNETPLTAEELEQDCLCYLTFQGKPVKASRLFAGNEHEQQVKRLAAHFGTALDYYRTVQFNADFLSDLSSNEQLAMHKNNKMNESLFAQKDLSDFSSYEEAYHHLIFDVVQQQVESTNLVLNGTNVKRMFVDGGFGKNSIYMHLLAAAFPQMEIFAASMAQATALGAALAIHPAWNKKPMPSDIIDLKHYGLSQHA